MRIRASFTLENAVIIPIFSLIVVVFIMITLQLHDTLIYRSIDIQVAMKLEQEIMKSNNCDIEKNRVMTTAVDNISIKSVFDVSRSGVSDMVKRIDGADYITDNNQPDFIRVVSAGVKLIDK